MNQEPILSGSGDEVINGEPFSRLLLALPPNIHGLRSRMRRALKSVGPAFVDTRSVVSLTGAFSGNELLEFLKTHMAFDHRDTFDVAYLAGALTRLRSKYFLQRNISFLCVCFY